MCKSRFKTVTAYAIACVVLFIAVHYTLYTYGIAIFRTSDIQLSKKQPTSPKPTESTPADPQLANEFNFDTSAILKTTKEGHSEDLLQKSQDPLDLTSLALRLNVSRVTFNELYFTTIKKVVYLRFQDEMSVYWKSEVPLYESKGIVLLFHNCKGNGHEWWSLLRDDFSFSHFQPKYSLPNEIRISSGFLQAGYWVVALSPVKNQHKNGCWVKEDRVYIPPLVEYLRILRDLSYEHHNQRQRHGSRPVHHRVDQTVSTLIGKLSAVSRSVHHRKPLPKLPIYGLGVTNGGAFLNQQLKYWLNPLPDTPPPSHPQTVAASHDIRKSGDANTNININDVPNHGFDGQGILRKRQPRPQSGPANNHHRALSRTTTDSVPATASSASSPLHEYLLATQPKQLVGPPVHFNAIVLLNAGIWHQEYFPPNAPKRKANRAGPAAVATAATAGVAATSVEAHEWALMPPVLFVDYARNGDVVWRNAQTLEKLQLLDARRAAVRQQWLQHHERDQSTHPTADRQLSTHDASSSSSSPPPQDHLSRMFAAQLISEPYPLYPEYFADQLAVLFPRNASFYPRHRVQLTKTAVGTTGSTGSGVASPFGATVVAFSDIREGSGHNNHSVVSMEPLSVPHRFTLPETAVYTVDDSVRLFFSLYIGDLLDNEEVHRLYRAYQERRQRQLLHQAATTEDVWSSTVQEILIQHQRDGIERFIWPGSNVLFKDVAGHIHLPRLLKLCHRSAPTFFRDVDQLTDVDPGRQDRGLHSPILQAIRKAWAWRETNDEFVEEMVAWFNDHR